jgi:hypothetical protein
MKIKNGHDLKAFLETLTDEQLNLPVMFDTKQSALITI